LGIKKTSNQFKDRQLKEIKLALIVGVIATVALNLPILGIIPGLLALPYSSVFPFLGKTGDHVTVGFLWLTLKTPLAWFLYILYFSVLVYGFRAIVRFIKGKFGK